MTSIVIHDWKDESYYKKLENEQNLTRWGWEFLRRNPEYQREYKIFSEFPDFESDGRGKNGKYRGGPWSNGRFYIDMFHYANPLAYKGESYDKYCARCPNHEIISYSSYLGRKYHFQPTPLSPVKELDDAPCFFFCYLNDDSPFNSDFPPWEIDIYPDYKGFENTIFYQEYKERYINRMKDYGGQAGVAIFAFDYTQPIDKQLERVRIELQDKAEMRKDSFPLMPKLSPKTPNLKTSKFPLFLRILDSLSAGIDPLTMRKVFFKGETNNDTNNVKNKMNNNIAAAERWRDYDYWKMRR